MWELSTPFVYMRWFLFTLGKTESKAYIINGLLMVGTFFVARNVFGTCTRSLFPHPHNRVARLALTPHLHTKLAQKLAMHYQWPSTFQAFLAMLHICVSFTLFIASSGAVHAASPLTSRTAHVPHFWDIKLRPFQQQLPSLTGCR